MKKLTRRTLRIISLLLVAGLALAACGGGNNQQNQTTQQAQQATQSAQDSQPPAETEAVTTQAAPTAPLTTGSIIETQPAVEVEPAPEGTLLRVRNRGDIMTMDPCFVTGPNDEFPIQQVYEPLVRFIPGTFDYEMLLAEKFEIRSDVEIYFKLREGVQFHKGYGEVTAEDVKWSLERFIDPEVVSPYAADWGPLSHVEVLSKYEGVIHLDEPLASLMVIALPTTRGSIMCKAHYDAVGLDAFTFDPVGTGPYTFVEWKPNEILKLQRNPDYYGKQSYYQSIDIIPIAEDSVAELALEAGDVDFSLIPVTSIDRFQNRPGYSTLLYPNARYAWIGMNMEHPKLKDINVRQAIRYGIDVPSILTVAYNNLSPWATAAIPPGYMGYWEDAPKYERDVDKAKGYMAAAGLTSLDLEIAIVDSVEFRTYAEIAKQNLEEVGINLTINSMDEAAFSQLGFEDRVEDVMLFATSFSAPTDPSWYTMWFLPEQIGLWNRMRWNSPEFNDMHFRALKEMDPVKRGEIYIEMQKLWDEACNAVWVTHTVQLFAYKEDIVPLFQMGMPVPLLRDFTSTGQ
ncbi:MAG: ABC transporter substrate-binding protein [Oscillospiraceae bacterium]|nr:ABC transporter substrate-binding protein [Oscillospiraceae bacterium]